MDFVHLLLAIGGMAGHQLDKQHLIIVIQGKSSKVELTVVLFPLVSWESPKFEKLKYAYPLTSCWGGQRVLQRQATLFKYKEQHGNIYNWIQ
ncbi:hypothetical protein [Paenibacillus sp. FSL R7-0179]|uniref:hypothetical protein n=1 Tax=Paenibacillus sp. FSL R7-0179 TaxID=2921672 RepID=UPI0030FC91CB